MGEAHKLRAGPLEATYSDGELRHVRFGGAEVVQRIYAAVRDHNWGTTPGNLENVSLQVESMGFGSSSTRFTNRVASISVGAGFSPGPRPAASLSRWTERRTRRSCAIGSASASIIHFGNARVNRVLSRQPLEHWSDTQFPEFVSPHQPFLNVRAITHDVAPGVRAEVRFYGDVFETEDHRNWTDANFKTYGTPLRLPYPVEVAAGAEVNQRIEIGLRGASVTPKPSRERLVRLRLADTSGVLLPRIGLGMASGGWPLSETELEALRRLKLNHLRVDLPPGSDWRPKLELAAAEAGAIGAKLEVAVTLPGDTAHLRGWAPIVDRWLVYRMTEKVTGTSAALELRAALGPEAFVAVGTNAYFAELNRNRPLSDGWDAACFSVNPQVHAFDDESVMANASAQFDAVRSALRFLGGRPVVVSPVTLRPRFNPDATGQVEPSEPDPRQKSPFCAAWTLASLSALARAGASSVTYFETRGAGGVLDGDETYPVFRVLEAATEFAGASVVACENSDESRVAALALEAGGTRRVLIANLTGEPREIAVAGQREALHLEPYAVTRLDSSKG
jgi:hypothetical protein